MDAPRRLGDRNAERIRDRAFDAVGGGLRIKPHGSPVEPIRRDVAEHYVGVGDGRLTAPAAIAHRARIGTSAVWTHYDHALVVAGDAAAAGSDLDHLYGRYVDGRAATPLVAHEVDLERRHDRRPAAVHRAEFGRGASHIEADDMLAPLSLAEDCAHQDASGWSRFDDAHRKVAGKAG